MLGEIGERHILANAERQDRALVLTVLRHIGNAGCNRIGGRTDSQRLAIQRDGSTRGRGDAEQALHGLGAAGADEAVEAQDLASCAGRRRCRHIRSRWTGP